MKKWQILKKRYLISTLRFNIKATQRTKKNICNVSILEVSDDYLTNEIHFIITIATERFPLLVV